MYIDRLLWQTGAFVPIHQPIRVRFALHRFVVIRQASFPATPPTPPLVVHLSSAALIFKWINWNGRGIPTNMPGRYVCMSNARIMPCQITQSRWNRAVVVVIWAATLVSSFDNTNNLRIIFWANRHKKAIEKELYLLHRNRLDRPAGSTNAHRIRQRLTAFRHFAGLRHYRLNWNITFRRHLLFVNVQVFVCVCVCFECFDSRRRKTRCHAPWVNTAHSIFETVLNGIDFGKSEMV